MSIPGWQICLILCMFSLTQDHASKAVLNYMLNMFFLNLLLPQPLPRHPYSFEFDPLSPTPYFAFATLVHLQSVKMHVQCDWDITDCI